MSFRDFFDAYLECAVWSSTDDDGTPLDQIDADVTDALRAELEPDARDFYDAHWEQWADGWDDAQAGHDFWLTRNRHGAGFWDRGLGPLGDTLTDAAHAYGEVNLYVGDDDAIHAN